MRDPNPFPYRQVETLQKALKVKMEDHNLLLVSREQYRGDMSEQNEQIHKMAARICELEQALEQQGGVQVGLP